MLTDKIGSYSIFVQGFKGARVPDSESALKHLREAFPDVDLQLLRADRVAGWEHITFAARNALDSFKGKEKRAHHLSMEFLLYAAGEHQIVEAIKLLGVTPSTQEIVFIGISQKDVELQAAVRKVTEIVSGIPDDTVLDIETKGKVVSLKKAYNVSGKQLSSTRTLGESDERVLQRLIIEKSALLALDN